jgi:hypothetical protein
MINVLTNYDSNGLISKNPESLGGEYAITINQANKLINDRAQVVYGNATDPNNWNGFNRVKGCSDTHQALLIGVTKLEERKVEVTESKLREAWTKAISSLSPDERTWAEGSPFAKFKKELGL